MQEVNINERNKYVPDWLTRAWRRLREPRGGGLPRAKEMTGRTVG